MLFVLALEPLLLAIKKSHDISGIKIRETEIRAAAFADDMTCFVSNVESAGALFALLNIFRSCSGLKINKEKSEGAWLGKWRNKKESMFGVKWPTSPIKIVGIHFSYDKRDNYARDVNKAVSNMKMIFNSWKRRKLSLFGKVLIIKTFGISQFSYILNSITLKKQTIQEVHKIMYEFLWEGKDKIARSTMMGGVGQGGLAMPNLYIMKKQQRILWIKHYLDPDFNHPWKLFLDKQLEPVGGEMIFRCNYNTKVLPVKLSEFVTETLDIWAQEIKVYKQGKDQIIWNNEKILIGGKSVYMEDFVRNGIMKVSDLFDANGLIPWQSIAQEEFTLIHKLRWLGLASAIPGDLKYGEADLESTYFKITGIPMDLETLTKKAIKNELCE
uniref:Uncharacterized protein LOC102804495 n=1 Tax=Saccoglossus kowalevskii TaxID=10224 RepID=A0ABM0MSU2_SACKO